MVGVSISAAFVFWLGKARMIENPIRGLGLDVDISGHVFIDWQKRRSYGKVGRYIFFSFFFFLFFLFRFSSVDGVTAGGVFTAYIPLRIMYVGVHVR